MLVKIPKKRLDKADEIVIHDGFEFIKVPVCQTNKNSFLSPEEKVPVIKTFKKVYAKKNSQLFPPTMVYCDRPVLINKKQNINIRTHKVLNLDIVGIPQSIAEAMIINTSFKILKEEGYKGIFVDVNCTGDKESINKFMSELLSYYKKNYKMVDCRCRECMNRKTLSILNCDHKSCQSIKEKAPRPISYLSDQSQQHFKEVLEYLEGMDIPYRINNDLITKNNHYSKTIFEIKGRDESEESVLAIGGRYDYMANKIAEKRNLTAVGISMKYKKLKNNKAYSNKINTPKIFLVQFGFQAKLKSLEIVDMLRKQQITILQNLHENKLSDQFRIAKKMKIPYMIIIGQKEAVDDEIIFKNMLAVSYDVVKINKLPQYLRRIKFL